MIALEIENPVRSMGEILHFRCPQSVEELQETITKLERERNRLKRDQTRRRENKRRLEEKLMMRDMFIRCMAQEYFSHDDKSRLFATEYYLEHFNRLPSEKEIVNYWAEHGGPEGFGKAFPDSESVMKYFRLLIHVKRRKANELAPQG